MRSIDFTTAWYLTYEYPSGILEFNLHKVSNLGTGTITTLKRVLTSASITGLAVAQIYTNPGKIFGTEVYFGGLLTGYTGCRSTGAAGGTMFIETSNANL